MFSVKQNGLRCATAGNHGNRMQPMRHVRTQCNYDGTCVDPARRRSVSIAVCSLMAWPTPPDQRRDDEPSSCLRRLECELLPSESYYIHRITERLPSADR